MENNKALSTTANTTSFPVLLNNKLEEIEAIPQDKYLKTIEQGETPEPVMKVLLSMAADTYKTCIERAYDGTLSLKELADKFPVAYMRLFKMLLVQLNYTVNIKEGFRPEQINIIPSLAFPEFSGHRINDVAKVCRLISTGKLPKKGLIDRLDAETFFRAWREYDAMDERISAREEHHRKNKQNKEQAANDFIKMPEEFKKEFTNRKNKTITLDQIPPMAFKVTQKDSMKKLRGDGRNE